MGYFLIDNPPASTQFYPSRNGGLSGGVVVHTTEGVGGDDSAENTAGYISRRSDPGSYHCLVDTNSTVMMMPDDYTAFGVGASGYNSTCWMIAIAARSSDLDPNSPYTQSEIDRCGAEIAAFWQRNGIDAIAAAKWIGEGVKTGPGLANHGDVQPWDRSDAWATHPQRARLEQLLIDAIVNHSGGYAVPTPNPEPTYPPSIPESAIWAMGATGYKVKEIQGIVGVNADGVFGPLTKNAVAQWQSNLGLVADGIWGPRTEEATKNLFAFLANLPMIEEVNPDNAFLAALNDAMNQILSIGSNGGAVKIAQGGLNGKGYPLVADGIFGPATDNAVRRFQSDNGLTVDGIVGPATWANLVS